MGHGVAECRGDSDSCELCVIWIAEAMSTIEHQEEDRMTPGPSQFLGRSVVSTMHAPEDFSNSIPYRCGGYLRRRKTWKGRTYVYIRWTTLSLILRVAAERVCSWQVLDYISVITRFYRQKVPLY